jgi:predicted Zn finger-like uncharacterized protein
MFTVCPKCALTLVVTAADLRVAQGYVRCGRCSSVFNALARLTEERQPAAGLGTEASQAAAAEPAPAAPRPPEAPAHPDAAAAGAESEEAIPDDALEFDPATTDVNSVFVQPLPDPQWTAATGSFRALVAANQDTGHELPDSQVDVEIDADFLASILRAESLGAAPAPPRPPTAAPAPQPALQDPASAPPPAAKTAAAPDAATQAPRARSAPPAPAPEAAIAPAKPAAAAAAPPAAPTAAEPPPAAPRELPPYGAKPEQREFKEEDFERDPAEDSQELPAAGARARLVAWLQGHAWHLGAALAAFVLVAQVLNHYRDDLAASARFNRPLTALYGSLGVQLFPRWDLHAYDVRQLGASADSEGAGVITVRASIKNGAPQPQPLPMLRVTLQDRFGNRIAARDVLPKSYLPGSIPPASFLSAGQRIDAEMGFADPGTDAVGFEIDACLPARGGGVACANDATLR